MDMKKILQAMDGIATKPVEGAGSMAKFLRVVKEAEINQPSAGDNAWVKVVANASGSYDVVDFEGNKLGTNLSQADAAEQAKFGDEQYKKVAPELSSPIKVYDEGTAPQVKVPEIPQLPAQDGDQGDGSRLTTNSDGTKTYAGAFGTFTYDAQGKAIKYSTPAFSGVSQTVDLTNNQTTQNYNTGPLNISQTNDANGKQVAADTSYDLGVTKLRQQTNATGQTTNTAYVPDGNATHVVQENSLSKFLSIVDKNNVSILKEGANPHKVTLPVQMAMQHYQQAKEQPQPRERLIDKYFVEAETEIMQRREEKRALINQYAKTIAERVLMKESAQGIAEAPIAMDPAEPNNPTIHNHQKANAMTLKGRIMSARAQLQELAELSESDSLLAWEQICKKAKGGMFMGLEQNLEQIRHGIEELAKQRRKGGTSSRGIDKHIGEGKRK